MEKATNQMANHSVSDITVERENKTKPKNKLERPKPHQVILLQDTKAPIPCTTCLLREVFGKSRGEAQMHGVKAALRGREIVMEAPPEVAEAKVAQANSFPETRGERCEKMMKKYIKVVSEPSP